MMFHVVNNVPFARTLCRENGEDSLSTDFWSDLQEFWL